MRALFALVLLTACTSDPLDGCPTAHHWRDWPDGFSDIVCDE